MSSTASPSVTRGPSVARWHCPCCQESVPRLLPNGQRNAIPLRRADATLPDAAIEAAAPQDTADPEICVSCLEAVLELVGSFVVLDPDDPAFDGFAFPLEPSEDQAPSVALVGAVRVVGPATPAEVWVFAADANGGLSPGRRIPFRTFPTGCIIYPETDAGIPAILWALYTERIEWLRARFGEDPAPRPLGGAG